MAAVWFTQVLNNTDSDMSMDFTDKTWRPWSNNQQFALGSPVPVPRRRSNRIFLPSPFPGIPAIDIPPGPTLLNLQYAFVGWADYARTRLSGPGAFVDFVVGPINTENQDYLRVLDEVQSDVVEPLPVGPRGAGWVASMDLHLIIEPTGIRPIIWSYTGLGANILARFDALATTAANELVKKVIQGIPIKFGG